MENEKPTRSHSEADTSSEVSSIDSLPAILGFVETPELHELKAELVVAMTSGSREEVVLLASRYHEQGALITEQFQGNEYVRAQMGLSVAMAITRRAAVE